MSLGISELRSSDGGSKSKGSDILSKPLLTEEFLPEYTERVQFLKNQLHSAVADNNLRQVKKILGMKDKHGSRLVIADSDQCSITPLHRACQLGLPHIVKALIDAGANVCYRDSNGRSPLHYACTEFTSMSRESVEIMLVCRRVCIKLLMQAGADPSAADKFEETPIDVASKPPQFVSNSSFHPSDFLFTVVTFL